MKKRDIWNNKEWINLIKRNVTLTEKRLWHLQNINYHDWRDIEQNIIIHVWNKRKLYNKKLPVASWINTITRNKIKNALRDRFSFGSKKKNKAILKNKFRFPVPITTKSFHHVDSLNQCVVYEPDIIDNLTIVKDLPNKEELTSTLNPIENQILSLMEQGKSIKQIAKLMKRRSPTIYSDRNKIRKKFNKLINE